MGSSTSGQAAGDDPPLRVDWLPASDLGEGGATGRLAMTSLPGKRGASVRYPGRVYRGNLEGDLAALQEAGVRRLILLVEDAELERWGDPRIADAAAQLGIDVDRYPMPDGRAPRSLAAMDRLLDSISDARSRGDVAVACMGGVGRTGTVAACALVAAGWTANEAVARVRELRHPTAVETAEQRGFVQKYWRERGRPSDMVAP